MDTIKIDKKGVKMIAHRGVCGLERENSIAAFVAAGNRSYFGIETDVHVTADGKFIIIHDDNTNRVTGVEKIIEESNFDELRNLKLFDIDSDQKRGDLCLPTLLEYINICKKYDKIAVLELKNKMSFTDIENIVREIESADYIENVIFISFSWDNVVAVKKIKPQQKVQYLTDKFEDELIEKLLAEGIDLDIYFEVLNEELIKKLHKNNIEVNCWTCDCKADADKLIEMGVDYITSDILE